MSNKKITVSARITNTNVDDPAAPRCTVPGHEINKNLYCADCADNFKEIVPKEADPNFVCQICNNQMNSPHLRHWLPTAVSYMEMIANKEAPLNL